VLGPFDILRELKAAAILLGTVFVLALVRRYLWEIYFGQKRQTDIPRFLQELAALVVFVVAVILVLNLVYGQNIPGLVAGSGIIAVILGLAMQDLLGNIFAGVSIHISKPFKPGDWLIADNQQAEVIEVNWRSTRLRTNDHVYLDIPNSHITKGTIVNYSFPTKLHAMRLRVGVDYSLPPNAAKDALIRAALDANGVLPSPRPKAFVVDFGDSAVIYEVKFWLENHALINEINDSIRTDIWYEFDRRRIKIPFPTRTLRREPPEVERTKEISGKTRASLRNQPIFQCLDDSQFDRMLSMGTRLRFGREEHIIRQGDEGESMFILMEGSAHVLIDRGGHQTQVGTLKVGDCFGEMSLLTGEHRSAYVEAHTDCEVIEIGKALFSNLLHETPALAEKLSDLLAHRRMENEGVLAATMEKAMIAQKQKEYAAGFFTRVSAFFNL
jgi:small-conductance mechanosensitive channel/CRP-like cAMP-binding protein